MARETAEFVFGTKSEEGLKVRRDETMALLLFGLTVVGVVELVVLVDVVGVNWYPPWTRTPSLPVVRDA